MSAQDLLAHLDRVSPSGPGKWRAVCPAHESKHRTQTLAVRECPDGTVLIKCFAGCGAIDVVESVGMKLGDLFPEKLEQVVRRPGERAGHRHALREAVETLEGELLVVAICAEDMAKGKKLTDKDRERMHTASDLIRRAVRACR